MANIFRAIACHSIHLYKLLLKLKQRHDFSLKMIVMCACNVMFPQDELDEWKATAALGGNNLRSFFYFKFETNHCGSHSLYLVILFSHLFSWVMRKSSSRDIFPQRPFIQSVLNPHCSAYSQVERVFLGLSGSETAVEQSFYHRDAGSGNQQSSTNTCGGYCSYNTILIFKAAMNYFHHWLIYQLFGG